ncbi:MAG: hydantoinase/oxoprolinase N-terminal domain-containing protein [Acidimicrobiia bacterium]
MLVGVDTGGTFTDVVGADGRIAKVLSTPDDPARAVAAGLAALGGGAPALLAHGTTVATNALLERRGARVALVTTAGLVDVIEIARQDRPSLYDQWADRPEPLVPRDLRLEVGGRLAADGTELEPVDPAALPRVPTAWRWWRCASCTPTSTAATSGRWRPRWRSGASTRCARRTSRPSSGSTSARRPPWSMRTCDRRAGPTWGGWRGWPARCWS